MRGRFTCIASSRGLHAFKTELRATHHPHVQTACLAARGKSTVYRVKVPDVARVYLRLRTANSNSQLFLHNNSGAMVSGKRPLL